MRDTDTGVSRAALRNIIFLAKFEPDRMDF